MWIEYKESTNIQLSTDPTIFMKREDLIHPFVSGNKYRKLKYNMLEAKRQGFGVLLTFGGAFSNHIAAVAVAGKIEGFKTIGIIRGEELYGKISENFTLTFAQNSGMRLEFISRERYRDKNELTFVQDLKIKFGDFYLIPEGGTNKLGVKGCEEILTEQDAVFDYICCAVGTGGTISGLINSSLPHQKILGFPVLKDDFLQDDIRKFAKNNRWELIADYHFGGYAKISKELIQFINTFYENNKISLDPVYTGKMTFGVMDLIQKGFFEKEVRILMIHTGGLQGIKGMNDKLKKLQLPILKINV